MIHRSYCRVCLNSCPTLVEVNDGALVSVQGDPNNPYFDGYTCVKGRALPAFHNHEDRLLFCQKRTSDGAYGPISSTHAMDEIADRLSAIVDRFGPRAVASYFGTATIANCTIEPFLSAFMTAIGSRMTFSPNTIDKPGKQTAAALHGSWMAPLQGYDRPDVALLIGLNPFKSYYGVSCGHPSKWLNERLQAGMSLIVIDPRRSDIAKRATLHLQCRPGTDVEILAGLLHEIINERLYDRQFVEANASGLDQLAKDVAPFSPEFVERRADVPAADIRRAARLFATADRGYAACGVGPGFSSSSTLVEYMVLNLETLCGHYLREGERAARVPTLLRSPVYKAQAAPPSPAHGFGERMLATGYTQSAAGMPTAALADEILWDDDRRVRALLSVAGNPVGAWPDQLKVIKAMESLDLLVQFDPWMSATSRYADYVLAPRMSYEVPGMTVLNDIVINMRTYYGLHEAHSHYTPKIVDPPDGSDVLAEWEYIHGIAQRMGLQLTVRGFGLDPAGGARLVDIDMERAPSSEWVLEALAEGSRVPLAQVKQHPSGGSCPEPAVHVLPKDEGWTGRLDLANAEMMSDLVSLAASEPPDEVADDPFPLRLVCRRNQHTMNSFMNDALTNRGRGYNPAFLHPDDLAALSLSEGQAVEVATRRASITAIVHPDPDLRRGLVSMAHGLGGTPDQDLDYETIGSPIGRLLDNTDVIDRYTAMPRMSGVPVAIRTPPTFLVNAHTPL